MTSHDDWYLELNVLTLDGKNFTGQSYIHKPHHMFPWDRPCFYFFGLREVWLFHYIKYWKVLCEWHIVKFDLIFLNENLKLLLKEKLITDLQKADIDW